MRSLRHSILLMIAIALIMSLAACGGSGGNTPILPDLATKIILASGGGAIFPAGSFVNKTDVLVSESLSGAQRDAASFPQNAGTLLGATRITVPAGVALAHDITVMIALSEPAEVSKQFTIFAYNNATHMWQTTEAGASSLRGISAQGRVTEATVVTFTAPTAGTTGLDAAYAVFSGYSGTVTGNHIPTVTLAATKTDPAVNESITLTATGADADGNTLTFSWLAPGGTLGTPAQTGNVSTVTWSAATDGTYIASVSCSDGNGGVATAMVTILIGVANDPPAWTESGTPPVSLKGDVSKPYNTQQIKFTAAATDPNGDPLTVTWADDTGNTGNFTNMTFDAATGTASAFWANATVGTYTITATVDDGRGGTDATTTSVTLSTLPTTFGAMGGEFCGGCHADKQTQWLTTRHHDALERDINTNAHGFRNEACYTCHAVGYAPVGKDGFIDQTLTPQFANIQCESCHGAKNPAGMGAGHKPIPWDPGKGYLRDANGDYVVTDGKYEYDPAYDGSEGYGCGVCHEGTRHGAFEEWVKSGHANQPKAPLTEDDGSGTLAVGPPGEANCVKCHNGQYFVSMQIKGGDAPAANLEVADMNPGMHITCSTCHDPHEAKNEKQLRVGNTENVTIPWDDTVVNGGWGNICLKCHNGRRTRSDYNNNVAGTGTSFRGPHGNAQGALYFGLMGADFGGVPVAYDKDHPHRTWNADTCTTCHMYSRPYIDEQNPKLWGHDWKPRFERCMTCHTNYTADQETEFWAWVESFQTEEVQSRLDAFVAAWPAAWKNVSDPANPVLNFKESAVGAGDGPVVGDAKGDSYRECLWNYKLILNDGTKGVHNPTYVEDLMDKSIARLNELNAAP